MSKKQLITCWLLAVYLVMAVGPAWSSLSCRCNRHVHAAEAAAGCCGAHAHHTHVHHHPDCTTCRALEQQPAWSASCCDDRHSTDIALYTGGDDDRTDRLSGVAVLQLAAAEQPLAVAVPCIRLLLYDPSPGALYHGSVRCVGAHAPPARV